VVLRTSEPSGLVRARMGRGPTRQANLLQPIGCKSFYLQQS
jgi:hypothetical protein